MSTDSTKAVRVCMLLPVTSPGSYVMVAQALAKRGFQVTLITLGHKVVSEEPLAKEITIKRLSNGGLFFSPFVSILNPLLLLAFTRSALSEKAGVYWGHGYSMLPVLLCLKLCGKRAIYDIGDDSPSNFSNVIRTRFHLDAIVPFTEAVFRAYESFVIRKMDYVVTLTESLKKDRTKNAKRIRAIYYCVDSAFNPENTDVKLHDKYTGFDVIIYSGTVALQKGFREVLASFEMVKHKRPKTLLLLVGGVLEMDEAEITKALSGRQDVIVTGWLPYIGMPKYITTGKVGLAIVNPINYSYKISVPFKLLEQMACGLPVIAPKGFPEIERIVKGANCGLLVDINKPEEIATAIIKLLEDEPLRQELSRNSIKYIEEHHNLELFEAETMNVFKSVLIGNE